jgi:hypothetical protein
MATTTRSALPLHIKIQICTDIETAGGLRFFQGSQGTSSQDIAYLLDRRKTLYGNRGSTIRAKCTTLVKNWYKKNQEQYGALCQQYGVATFCPGSPNPRSASKRTESFTPSSQSSKSSTPLRTQQSSQASTPLRTPQSSQASTPLRTPLRVSIQEPSISIEPRNLMSLSRSGSAMPYGPGGKPVDENRTVDLEYPERNGRWVIRTSKDVQVGHQAMTKVNIETSCVDSRDLISNRYKLMLSTDGRTVFATTPIQPHFLLHETEDNYHNNPECKEMILAGQKTSTRLFKAELQPDNLEVEDRKSSALWVSAYQFDDELTNRFFGPQHGNKDGIPLTIKLNVRTYCIVPPDPKGLTDIARAGVFSRYNVLVGELVFKTSVVDYKPEASVDDVARQFQATLLG